MRSDSRRRQREGWGSFSSLLRKKGINQNRLFTKVMLETGGCGGEKVRGGDGSGGITGSGEQDQPPQLHEAPRDKDLV